MSFQCHADIRTSESLSQREVQAAYDNIYREIGFSDPPSAYRRIVQLINPRPGSRMLDIACGEGLLLQSAAERGVEVCGLDLSPVAIDIAHRNAPKATLVVGCGEQLPWPDATFDDVVNLGSLEHFHDMIQGLKEMVRVLKPDGRACLILPNTYFLGELIKVACQGDTSPPMSPIERSATRRQWQTLLETHGLVVDRVRKYFTPVHLFQEGTYKMRSLRKFIVRNALQRCTPLNLAQEFIFLCHRQP